MLNHLTQTSCNLCSSSEGAFRGVLALAFASISSSVILDFLMIVRLVYHHVFAAGGTDGNLLSVGNAVDETFGGTLAAWRTCDGIGCF